MRTCCNHSSNSRLAYKMRCLVIVVIFRFSSEHQFTQSIEFGNREAWWQRYTASYPSAVEQEVQEHDKDTTVATIRQSLKPGTASEL